MKIGIHTYAWCREWNNCQLHLIDKAQSLGLDFIEIPLMVLEKFDALAVKKRLKELKFEGLTSTVLSGHTDITNPDANVRRNGIEYLKSCFKATSESGINCLSGVIYSKYSGQMEKKPANQEYEWSAQSIREVADYAKNFGATL